jgi:hypothetical protein
VLAVRPAPPPAVVYVERPTSPAPPPVPAPPTSAPAPPESVPALARRAASVASAPIDTLAAERSLLDEARRRLAAGEADAALDRLAEHDRRFPHPRLEEEREALRVEALAAAGKTADARAHARAFHDRWPTSVYGPAVDASVVP